MLSGGDPLSIKFCSGLPPPKKGPQKPQPEPNPIRLFVKNLSNSTKLKFDKNLIKLWVKFGKNLVPGNQGVEKGRFWPVFGPFSKCPKPTFC